MWSSLWMSHSCADHRTPGAAIRAARGYDLHTEDAMDSRTRSGNSLAPAPLSMLSVRGNEIVDDTGAAVRLRGTCIGGWMNMEDFIAGYPGSEHGLRAAMSDVLGDSKAHFFFDRL